MGETVTLNTLRKRKSAGRAFCCLTAYDAGFARVISQCGVEVLLVGDSLGMTIQGRDTTLPVTLDHMAYHTECVSRGNAGALILADLPFMCAASVELACESARRLVSCGAQAVKIEGGAWLQETVTRLADCGVAVCAHLGLGPQSVHRIGGYRMQGTHEEAAKRIAEDAETLQNAGAELMLLECVPDELAREVTRRLRIPVIGIGAGPHTDAQVLVLQDMLGLSENAPGFAPSFMAAENGANGIFAAIRRYAEATRNRDFPPARKTSE